jgi:hypothetical protein
MNRRMPKMPPTTITYIWLLSMMGRRTTEVDDGEQTRRRVQEERGEMERSGEGIRRNEVPSGISGLLNKAMLKVGLVMGHLKLSSSVGRSTGSQIMVPLTFEVALTHQCESLTMSLICNNLHVK